MKKKRQLSESKSDIDDPPQVSGQKRKESTSNNWGESVSDDSSDLNCEVKKSQSQTNLIGSDIIGNRNELLEGVLEKCHSQKPNELISKKDLKGTLYADEIAPDDELYTFQCPKDFCLKELLHKSLDLNKINDMNSHTIGSLHLEVLETDKKILTVALPNNQKDGCLINVPLKGHIIVKKTLEISELSEVDRDFNDEVKYPKDIKIRHPLLGVDWRTHTNFASDTINKQNWFKRKIKKEKNKKSKKQDEEKILEDSFEDVPKAKQKKST